jgi:hypothetical protein
MYDHNPEGTSDDFNSDNGNRGYMGHDEMCQCAKCDAHWARINARFAARA